MKPLISICVPVYNVAPYIERCVKSLMEQSYDNLEYIFVNDGSTDKSIELLQATVAAYPHRQAQVRILHNDCNHGLAYTRRVSIQAAQGEYIIPVDSDDFVEPDMAQALLENLEINHSDIAIGGCDYEDPKSHIDMYPPQQPAESYDLLAAVLASELTPYPLWAKIYKRAIFADEHVFAPEGMDYMEDKIVLFNIAILRPKISFLHRLIYHFVWRPDSVSAAKTEKHFRCLLQFWQLADQALAHKGLTAQYRDLTDRQKIKEKSRLMLFTKSIALKQQYARIFHEEEKRATDLQLTPGQKLMYTLVKYRLWGLIRLYQWYINAREKAFIRSF